MGEYDNVVSKIVRELGIDLDHYRKSLADERRQTREYVSREICKSLGISETSKRVTDINRDITAFFNHVVS